MMERVAALTPPVNDRVLSAPGNQGRQRSINTWDIRATVRIVRKVAAKVILNDRWSAAAAAAKTCAGVTTMGAIATRGRAQ